MRTLSEQEIRVIVERVGNPKGRGHTKKPVDTEMARAMLMEGFSRAQIGEYFGVSGMTVRRRLKAEHSSGIICQLKSSPPPSD